MKLKSIVSLVFCIGVVFNLHAQILPAAFGVSTPSRDYITIGSQVWTSKNLDVTTYRNGDPIPQVTDPTAWAGLTTGAWCYYNNDPANGAIYGKLYNWYAVNDSRGLAPAGWRIPTDAEWTSLGTSLGGNSIAGGKMKMTGTTYWSSPNTGATNSSGFSGLPGGSRNNVGAFSNVGVIGFWRSSTESDSNDAWYGSLSYSDGSLNLSSRANKKDGFSVRFIKDINTPDLAATSSATAITSTTASSGGTITSDNGSPVIARGIVYGTTSGSTTYSVNTGTGTGTFVSNLSGLSAATTYYVRSFATNIAGTVFGTEISFTTAAPIVTSGLVMHLDAGNTSSYPGSGTTWTDLTGNGYNGTLVNGPTYSSSNGGSIVFDGSNDVASFGNILNMGLNSWTLSCWVKFNSGSVPSSGPAGIIGKTSYRGYVGRYSFYIEDNNLHAFFQPDVNYIIITPVAPYLDNKFHNLVMTIDRTSMMYFYIDGVSVGTPLNVSGVSSINLNSSTDNFYIGSYGSSNGQSPQYFLNGNVSQASIYSRALTAAEVLQNYNALRPRFGDVTNPTTGKIWMDRNLGATQVASSSTDANSYGDLYQWGRAADGHQIRTSGTTSTFSSTDQPGNANFILGPNPPYDWRSTANSNLWQGVNGVNNPCPAGYRLPTQAEWDAERLSWSSQNAAGAFASPLKLPMAGRRDGSDGSITQVGTYGWYWSSTTAYQGACNCNISKRLYFFNTGFNNTDDNGRSNAFAVRCIKE